MGMKDYKITIRLLIRKNMGTSDSWAYGLFFFALYCFEMLGLFFAF